MGACEESSRFSTCAHGLGSGAQARCFASRLAALLRAQADLLVCTRVPHRLRRASAGGGLLLVALPGCLALTAGRIETRVQTGPTALTSELVPLEGALPRRAVQVQVQGPHVLAQVSDARSCVRHVVAQRPRTAVARVHYPSWMPWVAAAEALAGAGGFAFAALARSDTGASAAAAAGASLVGDALATTLAWLGVWQRPPPVALPAEVDHLPPRVEVCGVDLPVGATVEAHSRRGLVQRLTDGRGEAAFDMRAWPAGQFPYGAPLATVRCAGCEPVEVYVDATTAAALVRARNDPDDLAAWLDLHPTAADARAVRRQRDQLLRAIADQQDDALRQARRAMDDGDLVLAARLARGCVQVARVPAPACERLLAQIDDRFVQQQLVLGEAAIARQQWQAARDAHYRCRLVDRDRPACSALGQRLDLAQLRAQRLAFEVAMQRQDLPAAERAAHAILQLASDTPLAADTQQRLDALRRGLAQRMADELASRASRWVRKRKWARALVVLQACQAIALADTRACAALAERLPKGVGGW